MKNKIAGFALIFLAVASIIFFVANFFYKQNQASKNNQPIITPVVSDLDKKTLPPEIMAIKDNNLTGTIEKVDSQSLYIKASNELSSFENIPENLIYPVTLKFNSEKLSKEQILAADIKDENSLKLAIGKMKVDLSEGRVVVQSEKSQKFNITDNTFVVSVADRDLKNKAASDLKAGITIYLQYEKDTSNALIITIQ